MIFKSNFKVDHNSCGYLSVIKLFGSTSSFLPFLIVATTVPVAATMPLIVAPPAGSAPAKVVNAGSGERAAVPRQYHIAARAIPPRIDRPIIHGNCCRIAARISGQNEGIGDSGRNQGTKDPQYQSARSGHADERMLQIGVVLALGYLAFLAIWIWATRFRPR
jgi:hypothetical protein